MTRKELLEKCIHIVCKDRQDTHGRPEDSFGAIGALWTAKLRAEGLLVEGGEISRPMVAQLMILLKVARMTASPTNVENWLDAAGYAACGCEVATEAPLLGVPAASPEVPEYLREKCQG